MKIFIKSENENYRCSIAWKKKNLAKTIAETRMALVASTKVVETLDQNPAVIARCRDSIYAQFQLISLKW